MRKITGAGLHLGLLLMASAAAAANWPDLSKAGTAVGGGEADAALLVGIDGYLQVPPVPGAERNISDWYSFLVKSREVPTTSVTLLRGREATRERILKFAGEAARNAKPGGRLWVVFIGHGAPSRTGEDGVLVGADAQPDADSLYARSVTRQELLDALAKGRQEHTLLVLDACFSGRTSAGTPLVPGLQPLIPVSLATKAAARTTILSAAQADQFAGALPDEARPAFSYLALGALRGWGDADGDGQVTGEETLHYARDALQTLVKDRSQVPELSGESAVVLARSQGEKGPVLADLVLAGTGGGSELSFRSAVEVRVPRITVDSSGRQGIKDINIEAERRLDDALDAEDDRALEPQARAAAWCRLAEVEERNPYLKEARRGCGQWMSFAVQLNSQRANLAEDYQTLSAYLQLRRKSPEQKLAAVDGFLRAYRGLAEDPKYQRVVRAKDGLTATGAAALPEASADHQKGCDAGKAMDCFLLSALHSAGSPPLQRDEKKADAALEKACEARVAGACHQLAKAAVAKEPDAGWTKAAPLLQVACEAGEGEACRDLAEAHRQKRISGGDAEATRRFSERACWLTGGEDCGSAASKAAAAPGPGAPQAGQATPTRPKLASDVGTIPSPSPAVEPTSVSAPPDAEDGSAPPLSMDPQVPPDESPWRLLAGLASGFSFAGGYAYPNQRLAGLATGVLPAELSLGIEYCDYSAGLRGSFGTGLPKGPELAEAGYAPQYEVTEETRAELGFEAGLRFSTFPLSPALAAGLGYEWLSVLIEANERDWQDRSQRSLRGLNFFVQASTQLTLARGFTLDPFLRWSAGSYSGYPEESGTSTEAGRALFHQWLTVGAGVSADLVALLR